MHPCTGRLESSAASYVERLSASVAGIEVGAVNEFTLSFSGLLKEAFVVNINVPLKAASEAGSDRWYA